MDEKMNNTRVIIYGQAYQLKGDAPNYHLHEVAKWVDQKMNEIGRRNPKLDHARLAVLAAVNIADELLKVRKELQDLYLMLEEEEAKSKKE